MRGNIVVSQLEAAYSSYSLSEYLQSSDAVFICIVDVLYIVFTLVSEFGGLNLKKELRDKSQTLTK